MSDKSAKSPPTRTPAEYLASATAALKRLGFTDEQIKAFRRPGREREH